MQADANSVEAVVGAAVCKMKLEKPEEAKALLTQAAQRFPKSVEVLTTRANLSISLKATADAEKDLRAAIEAALADPKQRGAVSPFLALSSLLAAQAKPQEAHAILEQARAKLPDSSALQLAFGSVAEAQNKLKEAADCYRAAIQKDDKNITAWFHLGVVLRRDKEFDGAQGAFDKVLEADKEYPGLALERGALYEARAQVKPEERTKWLEEALKQFQGALTKTPDDPELMLRIGATYVLLGDTEKAIPQLRKVLSKRATLADAHFYLGRALMTQGTAQKAEARRELDKAVEIDGTRADFHLYAGWCALELPQPDVAAAKHQIDKALEEDKDLPEALWLRGRMQCIEGALDNGVLNLKRALELRPTLYQAHAALGDCYERRNEQGTSAAAFSEWKLAVQGDSTRPEWRYHLGKIQLGQGQKGDAGANLSFAADTGEKLNPKPLWLPDATFLAAEAARVLGKRDEALQRYQRYMAISAVDGSRPQHRGPPHRRAPRKPLVALSAARRRFRTGRRWPGSSARAPPRAPLRGPPGCPRRAAPRASARRATSPRGRGRRVRARRRRGPRRRRRRGRAPRRATETRACDSSRARRRTPPRGRRRRGRRRAASPRRARKTRGPPRRRRRTTRARGCSGCR